MVALRLIAVFTSRICQASDSLVPDNRAGCTEEGMRASGSVNILAGNGCGGGFQCCTNEKFLRRYPVYAELKHRTNTEEKLVEMLITGPEGTESVAGLPVSVENLLHGESGNLVIQLDVFRIASINQKEQAFTMYYQIGAVWRDCRLTHSCPKLFVGTDHPHYSHFWKPRIRIAEMEHDDDSNHIGYHIITGDGLVKWVGNYGGIFTCAMDFTGMPFDTHTCHLTLSLFGVPYNRLRLHWGEIKSSVLSISSWNIEPGSAWHKTSSDRFETFTFTTDGSTFGFNETVAQLTASFTIKRNPLYSLITYILPACFFYLISWVGLWIDISAVPARSMMAVIPVLILVNKMNQLHDSIPEVGYSTKLSNFLFLTLILLVVHTVTFGFCQYANRRVTQLQTKLKKVDQEVESNSDSDWSQEMLALPSFERRLLRCLKFLQKHWEVHERWLSPLVWVSCTLAIFLP